ncbi:MAG: cellulose-binding protein, partial [Chitinispirillia bacterium]|nr:cellulose-binding protein [Chitinispirillia bacterium]
MKKVLVVISFLAIALPVFAQTQMFNSCVENEGAGIQVTLPSTFNTANASLPDPFLMMGGSRMTSKEQWAQRRQETLRLLERTVYGTKPPKPASVTGSVTNTLITVNVSENGRTASFTAAVTLPSGTGPFPAVILYGNTGAAAATLRNWGVATINFNSAAVGSEQGSRSNKTGAFYTIYGNNSRAGLLVAWAWGVSRIIDVIEQSGSTIIRPDAIGVTGCSRSGKGAFVAGALDQRIALTIPMESGTGGTNIMRGAFADRDPAGGTNGAQSPNSAYGETYWLGDDFSAFTNNPNNLPVDIHQAIALIAPRGFFVMDKT